jgi:hypothetical protein
MDHLRVWRCIGVSRYVRTGNRVCIQQSPLFAWKKGMKAPDRSMHAARVAPKPCSSCPDASHSLFIGSDDAALGMFFFYHDTHEWRRTGAETSLISCKIKLLDLILCDSIFFWFVMAGRFYVTFKHTRELVHDRPYGSGHFLSWATSADRSDQRSSGVSSTGELNRPDVIVQMYSNNLSSSSITPSYLNARKFVRCGKKNVSKCAWKLRRRRPMCLVVQRRILSVVGEQFFRRHQEQRGLMW